MHPDAGSGGKRSKGTGDLREPAPVSKLEGVSEILAQIGLFQEKEDSGIFLLFTLVSLFPAKFHMRY